MQESLAAAIDLTNAFQEYNLDRRGRKDKNRVHGSTETVNGCFGSDRYLCRTEGMHFVSDSYLNASASSGSKVF